MIFELINLSDKCTFEAPNLKIAALVTCVLGNGQYSAKGIKHDLDVPFFLFGGHEEWFISKFGTNFEETLIQVRDEEKQDLADSFNSVLLGSYLDRTAFFKAYNLIKDPAEQKEWRKQWLDERRSSFNNICERAWNYAEQVSLYKPAQEGAA
ncbi:hypothetical protein RG113_003062 [Acinetobacter baumannii]|uniref:Uncharacterized protein n=5 Tax=Acinetobacter calcoaceticus/baumannii complex TaxID=909768 RepID=A0A0E1FDZ9_ACIBA|nr:MULTISPECIES: hypothetical protein [Acinetobacter]AIL77347.1 hypothetical protein IX87_01475 [Acinetobacter baumannii]AKQ31272.1 hypothetical protein ACX61_12915 [Acinetobacter baumannii]ASO72315.1 hypothetical protein Aba7804_16790 [Acinetobacter baumannii]ATD21688.1 hypothetical protein BS098_17985 [Acinetobacter baumannii]AXG85451.1 hypothetical protein Aba810CP_12060 [Acinetobacter baumannii]